MVAMTKLRKSNTTQRGAASNDELQPARKNKIKRKSNDDTEVRAKKRKLRGEEEFVKPVKQSAVKQLTDTEEPKKLVLAGFHPAASIEQIEAACDGIIRVQMNFIESSVPCALITFASVHDMEVGKLEIEERIPWSVSKSERLVSMYADVKKWKKALKQLSKQKDETERKKPRPKKMEVEQRVQLSPELAEESYLRHRNFLQTSFTIDVPVSTTVREVKRLSRDILNATLATPRKLLLTGGKRQSWIYRLEFASKEKAEANEKLLSEKSVNGHKIRTKSTWRLFRTDDDWLRLKSLYVSEGNASKLVVLGIPRQLRKGDLKLCFPNMKEVQMFSKGVALLYDDPDQALKEFKDGNPKMVCGEKVVIVYGVRTSELMRALHIASRKNHVPKNAVRKELLRDVSEDDDSNDSTEVNDQYYVNGDSGNASDGGEASANESEDEEAEADDLSSSGSEGDDDEWDEDWGDDDDDEPDDEEDEESDEENEDESQSEDGDSTKETVE